MKPGMLIVLLTAALALAGCEESPSDKVFGAKVRGYLLEHPEVLEEVAIKLQEKQKVEAEQQRAEAVKLQKAAMGQHRKAIEQDPRDFVANPSGKITVTEFFDYRCGYCKQAGPAILDLIAKNPDIRFVFKEFPILSPESEKAARAALALRDEGAVYLKIHQAFLEGRSLTEAEIDFILTQNGLDPVRVHKEGASPEITKQLEDIKKLAGTLGIQGTPHFMVGDEVVEGADLAALQSAIAKARRG